MSDCRIHILELIDSAGSGGTERQFIEIVNRIDRQLFDISVCFPSHMGIHHHELDFKKVKNYVCLEKKNKWQFPKILMKAKEIKNRIEPDIIHSWLWYSNLINIMIKSKTPCIISERASYKNIRYKIDSWWKRILTSHTECKADRVIVNSIENYKYLKKNMKYFSGKKVLYIPNGVDIIRFAPRKEKQDRNNKNNKIRIGHIGSYDYDKGQKDLVLALKKLDINFECTFIGEGSGRDMVINLANNKGKDDRFIFLDYQNNIAPFYQMWDIFVFPSHGEGMPNVVMEAMTSGLPVITTNIDGCQDLVKHGTTGLLIAPNDIIGLADAIKFLVDNTQLRKKLALKGNIHIINNYSFEKVTRKYEKIYIDLLKEKQKY